MRHQFFFPFLLIVLTLLLAFFMGYAFQDRLRSLFVPLPEAAVVPVDASAYESSVFAIINELITNYPISDASTRSALTDHSLQSFLALRVPASHKDTHLTLAFRLNTLKEEASGVIQGGAFVRLQESIVMIPWLAR